VRFKRKDDVEENEEREHECLDEPDEELQPDEREGEARDKEQSGEHREHDLAAPDVSPESKGKRQDAEELAEELDDADEDHDDPDERTFPEAGEIEPANEVTETVLAYPGGLIPGEPGECHAEVGVVVGGWRMQELDLADERYDREPVAEEREQEERPEERQEPNNPWAAGLAHEIDEPLHDELERALQTAGLFAQARRGEYRDD